MEYPICGNYRKAGLRPVYRSREPCASHAGLAGEEALGLVAYRDVQHLDV
jgi:hypothetical protein